MSYLFIVKETQEQTNTKSRILHSFTHFPNNLYKFDEYINQVINVYHLYKVS